MTGMGQKRKFPGGLISLLLGLLWAGFAHAGEGFRPFQHFKHLNVEEGLSQPSVTAVVKDDNGYLWIGTQDGLNRFDGYDFHVFRSQPDNPLSLSSSFVTTLIIDAGGTLWIGTAAGLSHLQLESGRIERLSAGLNGSAPFSGRVRDLYLDGEQRLWLASDEGLFRLDRSSMALERVVLDHPLLEGNALSRISGDHRDRLWLLGKQGLPLRFDPRFGQLTDLSEIHFELRHLDTRSVTSLFHQQDSTLWLGHRDGRVSRLELNTGLQEQIELLENADQARVQSEVATLEQGPLGHIWAGTLGSGLFMIDYRNKQQKHFGHQPRLAKSLANNFVHQLYKDPAGVLWVATQAGGLDRLTPNSRLFAHYRQMPAARNTLLGTVVWSVHQDRQGLLWIGTDRGLNRVNRDTGLIEHIGVDPDESPSIRGRVYSIVEDAAGRLWVATEDGVDRIDPVSGQVRHFGNDPGGVDILANRDLRTLFITTAGELWAGGAGGLSRFDPERQAFENLSDFSSVGQALSQVNVFGIAEAADGALWATTFGAGVFRINSDYAQFDHYRSKPNDEHSISSDLTGPIEILDGMVWIGSTAGVDRLDPANGQIRRYGINDGLPSATTYAFQADQQGKLWISTSNGLARLDPDSDRIDAYSVADGLQHRDFTGGCAAITASGELMFGGVEGLNIFRPEQLGSPQAPEHLRVTGLLLFNQEVAPSDQPGALLQRPIEATREITLDASQGVFSLLFAASDFVDAESVLFAYKLQGFDADWIATDAGRRLATYTNLDSGQYQFHLRARYRNSPWSEGISPLQITILPAWYQTWWAIALAVIIPLAIANWIVRERRKRFDLVRNSEEQLTLALWGSGDQMWDRDLQSETVQRRNILPGFPFEEIEQMGAFSSIHSRIHPDDRGSARKAYKDCIEGRASFLETSYRVKNNDGEWRWLLDRGKIVERAADGTALRMSGTIQDVTEERHKENKLRRLNDELRSFNEHLEDRVQETAQQLEDSRRQLVDREKMASLGELVAGVAHELNTPIGVGVSASTYLKDELSRFEAAFDGEAGPQLERLLKSGHMAAESLITNLQRSAELVEDVRRFDLTEYIDSVLVAMAPSFRDTRHQVQFNSGPGIQLTSVPGAIAQVLANLMTNSLLHGFDGVDQGLIEISVKQQEQGVVIDYRDNGVGAEQETINRMFEPFFTTKRGRGGTGLGMNLVYNLVTRILNGQIECIPIESGGLAFNISIPDHQDT
jgi:ligand-binding sensor domain-containing protein/signal transduction histidine kinase